MNEELYNKLYTAGEMLGKINSLMQNRIGWENELKQRKSNAEHTGAVLCFAAGIFWVIINIFMVIPMFAPNARINGGIIAAYLLLSVIPSFIMLFFSGKIIFYDKEKDKKSIKEAEDAISAINDEIKRVWDYQKIVFLPEEYRYELAVAFMAKEVYDNRVDTLEVALDRYDRQLFRWSVEHMQEAMLAEQQRQSILLAGVQATSFATGVGVWMNN